MAIFFISQGNEGGLGKGCIILRKWEVISLTFGLSSWKGKSTSCKTFVKILSIPLSKFQGKEKQLPLLGN